MGGRIFRYITVAALAMSGTLLSACSRVEGGANAAHELAIILALMGGLIAKYPIPSALVGVGVAIGLVMNSRNNRSDNGNPKE